MKPLPRLKSDIDVLAIVVNYNTGSMLGCALDSLLASSIQPYVVVVDNASSDESAEFAKNSPLYRGKVEFVINKENLGFAKANNQILGTRQAKYFLLMNPDCVLDVSAIQEFVSNMESNPEIGLAGGTLKNTDGTIQKTSKRRFPTPMSALARTLGVHRFNVSHKALSDFDLATGTPVENTFEEVEAISGALMFVRGSVLYEVGLLDEGYFMHCEDLDWCKRFRDAGSKVAYVPAAVALHHKGGSGRSPRVVWHLHRGMIRFYRKHYRSRYPLPVSVLVYAGIYLRCLLLMGYSAVARSR